MPEDASTKQESFKLQSSPERKERMLRRWWGLKPHPMDAGKPQESTGRASMSFRSLELKSQDETDPSDPGQTGHFTGWEN